MDPKKVDSNWQPPQNRQVRIEMWIFLQEKAVISYFVCYKDLFRLLCHFQNAQASLSTININRDIDFLKFPDAVLAIFDITIKFFL